MKTFNHIIWDWNGTLWDDTWLCVEINNHMLERRGLPPITIDTYRDKLCFPVDKYYCQLGFDYSIDPYKKLAEAPFRVRTADRCARTNPFPA